MREYGRTEVIREKCHWCGCKNKLVTYLKNKNDNEEVAMIIRCCACGKILSHVDPAIYSSAMDFYNRNLVFSRDKCVQESWCPHKSCPHYGKTHNRKRDDGPKYPTKEDLNNLLDVDGPYFNHFDPEWAELEYGIPCKAQLGQKPSYEYPRKNINQ